MPEYRAAVVDFETCDLGYAVDPARGWDTGVVAVGRYNEDGKFAVELIRYCEQDVALTQRLHELFAEPPKPPLWRRLLRPLAYAVAAAAFLLLSSGAS